MTKHVWTTEEVADRVEMEGLDYAILHYIGPDEEFEDKKLKRVWLLARKALFDIEDILDKALVDE